MKILKSIFDKRRGAPTLTLAFSESDFSFTMTMEKAIALRDELVRALREFDATDVRSEDRG